MSKETLNITKEAPRKNSPVATASISDRTPLWVSIFAVAISVSAFTLQHTRAERLADKVVAAEAENKRLNTLILNHTDKLDNDTVVAQHLLAAATSAMASCKR